MGREAGLDLALLAAVQGVNERQRALLGTRLVQQLGESTGAATGSRSGAWPSSPAPTTCARRPAWPSSTGCCGAARRSLPTTRWPCRAAARHFGPREGLEFVTDPLHAAQAADALLIVTEWREFRSPDFEALRLALRQPLVFDGRNLWDPAEMAAAGFDYRGIGRGMLPPTSPLALAA
jgi:UDPglucose 6-dehydrogenase